MTDGEVIEVLEKEESYMLSHGGDRQAKALRVAIDKMALEQDKPMVEIDLYSVIKQSYIEREVLDKIRAEIEQTYETDIGFLIHDETKRTVLNIIDKYRQKEEE